MQGLFVHMDLRLEVQQNLGHDMVGMKLNMSQIYLEKKKQDQIHQTRLLDGESRPMWCD